MYNVQNLSKPSSTFCVLCGTDARKYRFCFALGAEFENVNSKIPAGKAVVGLDGLAFFLQGKCRPSTVFPHANSGLFKT